MNTIEETIRNHGQKRNIDELKEYLATISLEQLNELVIKRIHRAEFISFLNYLLEGFNDTVESHEIRFQICLTILKQTEKQTVPRTQIDTIVTCLCMELVKFKSLHLLELCDFCMACIQTGNFNQLSWKEIFPVLLQILLECENVEYNGDEMTGKEYKNQIISSLLMLNWSTNIITPLADMFILMPLTKDEHFQITKKLCQYIDKLTSQEIPGFVYNVLQLCKNQNGKLIFFKLQQYFGDKIYSNTAITDRNTENMDIIEDSSYSEAIQSESTILLHIHQSASNEHDSIKDYLSALLSVTKSPESVMHPFNLTVLLSISTITACYEEKIFGIIKSAISRTLNEDNKKLSSIWFREMVPIALNLQSIFRQIINCSVDERDLVVQGLVTFSLALLGVGAALGREAIAEKQWELGTFIIMKLMKRKKYVAHNIIQTLSNYIITSQHANQYIDCLSLLTRKHALIMLENQSCVVELMEQLIQVPGVVANEILEAIIPLTKVSSTIRDHLILLLRKALYSRVTETRQVAVAGFLILLRNLKISNLAALSQSSNSSMSSGRSVMSQISLTHSTFAGNSNTFSNEALCLEVLGILRRCFMQQAAVKVKLYDGLYDAVCMNPDLGVPVLDLMWSHFSTFYEADEDILPPLKFTKITQTKDADVILMEPMGKFIYAIGSIFTKVMETAENEVSVRRFTAIFESLASRMAQCELVHFELDDGTDLLDILPESQEKVFVLKEAICVYEAVIGYRICSWSPESDKYAESTQNLFQGYNRLVQFSKNLSKPKKGDKKKGDANKTTQSEASRKEGGEKRVVFKMPDTILDFQVVGKLLNVLHKDVAWTSQEQANILKRNLDIHQYVIQVAIALVQNLKSRKNIEESRRKMYYGYCTSIAETLYSKCISRFKTFLEFDLPTAILALDCFYAILKLINSHYKTQWITFLASVGGKEKDEEIVIHLTDFVNLYRQLFEENESGDEHDNENNKISLILINTLSIFASHISTQSNPLAIQLLDWTKEYASKNKMDGKLIIVGFINLMFNLQVKYKCTTTLLKNIATKLSEVYGTISDDEIDAIENIEIINEGSVGSILSSICSTIKSMLDDIDWIILRLSSEYNMVTYHSGDLIQKKKDLLQTKERGLCCQICQVISMLCILSNVSMPTGPLSEIMIKNNTHVFNMLTSLGKYFFKRSSKINLVFQTARFDSVVKMAGKKLAPVVYRFILYIEQKLTPPETDPQTPKKKKSKNANIQKTKVLRDTRLIPKLVFEIEQFSKVVIQLSNKTKVDLSKYVGQGTARDFRIKDLKAALENEDGVDDDTQDEGQTTQASEQSYDDEITAMDTESGKNVSTRSSTRGSSISRNDTDEESDIITSPKKKKQKKK